MYSRHRIQYTAFDAESAHLMGILQQGCIVLSIPFEAELDDDAMATAVANAVCRSCALAADVACALSAVNKITSGLLYHHSIMQP